MSGINTRATKVHYILRCLNLGEYWNNEELVDVDYIVTLKECVINDYEEK